MLDQIQEAVRACLQRESGIHTVCAPAVHTGEYPLLAVDIRESGSTLLAGGSQAEQGYEVTVTAAEDRLRHGETALLGSLVPILLRGVPMENRFLHPLDIRTEGDTLCFSLQLCVPVPPKEGTETAAPMVRLHFNET